jgi:hypothetical protein
MAPRFASALDRDRADVVPTSSAEEPDVHAETTFETEVPYEPPIVESVLTADDLEREIHCAGDSSFISGGSGDPFI